ncbi:hypothetical protein BT67DRAFT_464410, partial [Trichocladium antarcticum]
MFDFASGCKAPPRGDAPFHQTPAAAECFLPPPTVYPRPWQRVAVAPVSGQHRQRRIWKRVGGTVVAPGHGDYVRAVAELARDGQEPRKRARQEKHIPVWGDARWDPKVEHRRDGKWDLIDARASVSIADQDPREPAANAGDGTKTRPALFPEEALTWVPRKRHNSRWPIEPKKETNTRMVADVQPLTEFDVPASPACVDVALRLDDNQMRRRSTRRLSRRVTLIPGDDSPRKLPMATLSPSKIPAPMLSPVKRPPVTLSPTKVADSPHRSFRVNATPTKVVLESPQGNPPASSPLKPSSSPIIPAQDAVSSPAKTPNRIPPAKTPASPLPLMFDQPMSDAEVESQHEARRRLSLQSARRTERGPGGILRLLALKTGRTSPNRRHSFTSAEMLPEDVRKSSKSRRNTLDAFCVGPDEIRGVAPAPGGSDSSAAYGCTLEGVVEVDMKTSSDMFSQPSKPAEDTSAISPTNDSPAPLDVILSSPTTHHSSGPDELEAGVEAEDASLIQTTTSLAGGVAEFYEADLTFDSSPEQPTFEALPNSEPEDESDIMYGSYEPEGLSTIYEESSFMETQTEQVGAEPPLDESAEPNCSSPSPVRQPSSPALPSGTPQLSGDVRPAGETMPEACGLVDASTNHVGAGPDALSASDSPQPGCEASLAHVAQAQSHGDDEVSFVGFEEPGIISVPNNTFSGTFSLETETMGAPSEDPPLDASPPGTPTQESGTKSELPVTPELEEAAALQESSGFTPINTRQISPPHAALSMADDQADAHESESDDFDEEEVVEEELGADLDDEPTAANNEEFTVTAEDQLRVENDTFQLQALALRDDSETEMLRNFVTRVAADKNAKAAAAAAALANKLARPKRRPGSTGSISSLAGSPIARAELETPADRKPLGVKSPNSPSPTKKRKLEAVDDAPAKDKDTDGHDAPRLKRRRKRAADPVLETPAADDATTR